MSFVIYSHKTGKYLNQHFFAGSWPGTVWIKQYLSNFDSTPLTPPCFLVKLFQLLRKVIVFFPERRGEIKTSFWHVRIAQWLKFFCTATYFFRFWPSSGPKLLTLGPSLFHKYANPSKIFKQCFCFCLLEYYLWWEFRQYWSILGEQGPKTSKKGLFRGCWIGTQNVGNF